MRKITSGPNMDEIHEKSADGGGEALGYATEECGEGCRGRSCGDAFVYVLNPGTLADDKNKQFA